MIDLHCHILFGMDDGADSFQESLGIARIASDNEINTIVATPHFFKYDEIFDFIFERDVQTENLNKTLKERGYNVTVVPGSEVFLDGKIFVADNLDELTINHSKYMLCEYMLERFDAAHAIILAEEVINRGYIPIIAHPERYITFYENPAIINELSEMGCFFQVNVPSVSGQGGKNMQDFSIELINRGFVDFLATDAHATVVRTNSLTDKFKLFPDCISDEQIEWMLTKAPQLVLENKELPVFEREYF